MTAQIAVFNLNGVAIASDSTTTVSNPERTRTFSGAQKLFELGPGHRAVVMTSGEARFMRVPYSVLIPKWAATLQQPLPTVADYAREFRRWLPQQQDLFGPEEQEWLFRWMLEDYYLMIRSRVQRQLSEHGLSDADWIDPDVCRLVTEVILGHIEALDSKDALDEHDTASDDAYVEAHQELIATAFGYALDDVPHTLDADEALLHKVPRLVLSRQEPWNVDSTVAFIGYGAQDTFPGHQVLELTGIVDDRLRYCAWEPANTSVDRASLVTPFAQSEAIQTFLRAYNSAFPTLSHDRLEAVGQDILAIHNLDEDTQTVIRELLAQGHEDLTRDIESHSWERFISPMLNTVEALPIGELAGMAESLVGIQALRSHSSDRQPSVGGAIALVTIAPDTGVVWHRRHAERSFTP